MKCGCKKCLRGQYEGNDANKFGIILCLEVILLVKNRLGELNQNRDPPYICSGCPFQLFVSSPIPHERTLCLKCVVNQICEALFYACAV